MRNLLLQTTTTTKQARLGKAANKQKIDKTRNKQQMQQKKGTKKLEMRFHQFEIMK